jgi:hypothetical protein
MPDADNPQGIGLHEAQAQIMSVLDRADGTVPDNDQPVAPEEDATAAAEDAAPVADNLEDEAIDEEVDLSAEEDAEEDLDDGQDPDEDEEQPDEDTYLVKVGGEDVEVTLTELMKGYSRNEDYTRKTMQLSEERKSLEEATQQVHQERAQYAQMLPVLNAQIQAGLEQEPDWDTLYQQNPQSTAQLKKDWEAGRAELEARRDAILAEQQRLNSEALAEQQDAFQRHLAAEQARLSDVIPEWADAKRANQENAAIRQWAIDQGLSEDMVASVDNADVVGILRKAWLYDQGSARVQKKRKGKSRTMKPGAANSSPTRKASAAKRSRQKLSETGSLRDGAAAIEHLL